MKTDPLKATVWLIIAVLVLSFWAEAIRLVLGVLP